MRGSRRSVGRSGSHQRAGHAVDVGVLVPAPPAGGGAAPQHRLQLIPFCPHPPLQQVRRQSGTSRSQPSTYRLCLHRLAVEEPEDACRHRSD